MVDNEAAVNESVRTKTVTKSWGIKRKPIETQNTISIKIYAIYVFVCPATIRNE